MRHKSHLHRLLLCGLLALTTLACGILDVLPTPSPLSPPVETPVEPAGTSSPAAGKPTETGESNATAEPAPLPTAAMIQTLEVESNMQYGEADGVPLLADIYSLAPFDPTGPGRPAVILIHGGGWAGGSKYDFAYLGEDLANRGYVAFSISYRLVGGGRHHFPAQLEDVQAAVRWVRANAAEYGVDPDRIAALGASAGGHLAAFLGVTDNPLPSGPARQPVSSRATCVVDLFGPVDLTAAYPVNESENVEQIVINLIGQPREQAPDLYRQASPIFFIDGHTVPFFIAHGDQDPVVPVEQSRSMVQALQEAGVEVEYLELEGEGHGFIQPQNQELFTETLYAFLNRCALPSIPPALRAPPSS